MTTTVSQVEVTQADREAVAEFHRQSLKTLFATTDADIDAGINRAHELLVQAFARHRQSAERGEVVACRYPVHGSVTHVRNIECCDFCGYPADTLPTPPEAV